MLADRDLLTVYLREAGAVPLLSRERELELARQVQKGGLEADRAKQEMAEANLRLVVSVAKRYSHYGVSLLDLIQEGNLGLLSAIDTFDPERGFKFSDYAAVCIRGTVLTALDSQVRAVRLPAHLLEFLGKMRKETEIFYRDTGMEPTAEELACVMKTSVHKIREALESAQRPVEVDAPLSENGNVIVSDCMATETNAPDASAEYSQALDTARTVLDKLPERERRVLALRFGLTDEGEQTLAQVGRELNISKERARQIEAATLTKLKGTADGRKLYEAMLYLSER